jgi:hypothetical protein
MTIKKLTFFLLTLLVLTSCRRGYKVEGDKIYYEYWNEGSGQGKRLIEKADAKTFQTVEFDCDCSFDFGKDKNHLFIDGEPINDIDPKTFKFIGNYIFSDKDNAYFFGSSNNLNDCAIKGIKPNQIQLIKYPWAKAGNILINGYDTLHLDDIKDFVPIDEYWGKTKKHIINNNQILYGADVETFKVKSTFQGTDKNFNYEFGAINEDDFKKVSYKTFDFARKNFCKTEPIVYVDVYDNLVSYSEDKDNPIAIVEKMKQKGFKIKKSMNLDWGGESKIIRTTMTNYNCSCIVEKLYRYDYGIPSENKNIFKVTERIYLEPK